MWGAHELPDFLKKVDVPSNEWNYLNSYTRRRGEKGKTIHQHQNETIDKDKGESHHNREVLWSHHMLGDYCQECNTQNVSGDVQAYRIQPELVKTK